MIKMFIYTILYIFFKKSAFELLETEIDTHLPIMWIGRLVLGQIGVHVLDQGPLSI
jgi:hypothetical protein